jgi:hypothetical protein
MQHAVTHYGTVVTQTFGVTIATANVWRSDAHDIIADLEDEITDKAVFKYQRNQQFNGHKWDSETYSFFVTKSDDEYHAFTSGVKAKERLAEVLVTVFGMTNRM